MATIGIGVSHNGLLIEDWMFPWNLQADIVAGDVGKAVTQDATAARTVKLAGDGDPVIGRLETFEDRVVEGVKVGAVSHKGAVKMPYKTGETMVIGGMVTGAGSGEVKPLAAISVNEGGSATKTIPVAAPANRVTAIDTTAKTVEVILF